MQQVNGVPVYSTDPSLIYAGLDEEPTWFSAQGGVYKCFERSTNKQVAIKKYLVEDENPYPDMFVMPKELVENEIYSMTKCIHSNILKLYSVHLHQEFVYLIMPLCTGGSLQQYVFEHHLTVGQLVHIITSIASGLAKVHGNGYIHRDIKCDNIFLDQENNNIVIGDFGVVSISPAADSSVEEAGVVLFWSPELVLQKIVNHKIDIWALGIVILEILNGGKAPYEDEKLDEEEIKQRILDTGRPEYPPQLPSLLVDLLDHCLDPNPQTRYSANSVLQHPFLKHYEPELLFPATRFDHEISSPSESEPSESLHSIIEQDKPTLDKYDEPIDPIPTNTSTITVVATSINSQTEKQTNTITTTTTTTTTIPNKQPPVYKCRLPIPAFSVDKDKSAAVPVKETIANVLRKRQTMSDLTRHEGCKIPMLCILQPKIENIVEHDLTKLKSAKPVKLNAGKQGEKSPRPKTLARANTMPIRTESSLKSPVRQVKPASFTQDKSVPKRTSPKSPSSDKKPTTPPATPPKMMKSASPLPTESSVYRKRLPAGESRTARLMMGLSTNGRRMSYKYREENQQTSDSEISPTLGYHFGKFFGREDKKRPISFGPSMSTTKPLSQLQSLNKSIPNVSSISPEMTNSQQPFKRQSVPVSPKSPKDDKNNKKMNKDDGSLKNSIKALRVH